MEKINLLVRIMSEEYVKEIIRRQGEDILYQAAMDILRAMVILYGSAWERDLRDVLMTLWSMKNLDLREIGELQEKIPEAVKLLRERDVLQVERRLHAVGVEPEEEDLYTARDITLLIRLLSADREISRYRFEVQGAWLRRTR